MSGSGATSPEETLLGNKLVLTPLIGLMNGRSSEDIQYFTILEIIKHRHLRDQASQLEIALSGGDPKKDRETTEREYVSALIAMHAQQTVVSTLIDILGYIPDISERSTH